jgi:Neprosin
MVQRKYECSAAILAMFLSSCGSGYTDESPTDDTVENARAEVAPPKRQPTLDFTAPQPLGYAWAGGYADFITISNNVKSITGQVTVSRPIVRRQINSIELAHSLAEIAALDTNGANIAEVGWIVYDDDPNPRLFVFYWVDGLNKCTGIRHYRCSTFVSTHSTIVPDMVLPVGAQVTFGITHVDSGLTAGWHFLYNGTDFGYIPDSVWTVNGRPHPFTSMRAAQWFGEVSSQNSAFCSQMGSGFFASDPSANAFTLAQYTVLGQAPVNTFFSAPTQTQPSKYTAAITGALNRAPVRFGGPYPNSPFCPTLPPPPCTVKSKRCCGGALYVCEHQSCPIVCPPPDQ